MNHIFHYSATRVTTDSDLIKIVIYQKRNYYLDLISSPKKTGSLNCYDMLKVVNLYILESYLFISNF